MEMCHLRVVLFVSGRGADSNQYKPDRDETQWWSRRDALVRTVAAFLFGPQQERRNNKATNHHVTNHRRELVLLFDEDLACMRMSYNEDDLTTKGHEDFEHAMFPSERCIVSIWKEATSTAMKGTEVSRGGLKCQIIVHNKTQSMAYNSDVSLASMSKRDVLDRLQKCCSIDFLRQHNLNSSSSVALRKVNRKNLLQAWHIWRKQQCQPKDHSSGQNREALESILIDLVHAPLYSDDDSSSGNRQVIAGTLHESSRSELPCWNLCKSTVLQRPVHRDNNIDNRVVQMCLFLGAVRDMSQLETKCLAAVCNHHQVPRVQVRLGPVAEFTSKILTVVAFHHSTGVLWPSIQSLLNLVNVNNKNEDQNDNTHGLDNNKDNNNNKMKNKRPLLEQRQQHSADDNKIMTLKSLTSSPPPALHVVVLVPLCSHELTTDLNHRNRVLWCLVRCTVACLWRSRLAERQQQHKQQHKHLEGHEGDGTVVPVTQLQTSLTFQFQDGVYLKLDQDSLVFTMAEKHQAAPSEYQILHAIQEQVKHTSTTSSTTTDGGEPSPVLHEVIGSMKTCCRFALDLVSSSNNSNSEMGANCVIPSVADYFYSQASIPPGGEASYSAIAFLCIAADASVSHTTVNGLDSTTNKNAMKPLLDACQAANIPILPCTLLLPNHGCTDWEAATITLLQHFAYQQRLLGFYQNSNSSCNNKLNNHDTISTSTHKQKRKKRK